jgi:hypothetical protein
MRKFFLLFTLLFSIAVVAMAQNAPITLPILDTAYTSGDEMDDETPAGSSFDEDVLQDTTISFSTRTLQYDSIARWKTNKEYAWIKNADSFLLAMKKEATNQPAMSVKQQRGPSFLDVIFASGIIQIFLWLAAAALVIFIVYKLFLSEGIFSKRSAQAKVQPLPDENDITLANDYDGLLKAAYDAGNFKNAMRYIFLKTLQKLNDKGLIKFAADKTNSMYARELPEAKKSSFANLALYYEYSWYGSAVLPKDTFDEVQIKFNDFLNKI